jgi:hypothetical protein
MDVVFGPEGLADVDTSVLFEEKSTQVVDEMKDHPSIFSSDRVSLPLILLCC